MTQDVVATVRKVNDVDALALEIGALLRYIEHTLIMREVKTQRMKWEEDRQAKVTEAIAKAMKDWDDEHYPRLLHATWGWHPFYPSFVANPLCASFRPPYPLTHSLAEGWDVHSLLLQQSSVRRIYPVPWSVLLIRCFLTFHVTSLPLVSHPTLGSTVGNVAEWSKLAQEVHGDGSRAWRLAIRYLKFEGFLLFAAARPVDSHEQWVAEVDDATEAFMNANAEWSAELQTWCNTTRFRAVQDMAYHDRQTWLKAWVIRERPADSLAPLACYNQWLQHREDLDIGYVLAMPGNFCDFPWLQYDLPAASSRIELTLSLKICVVSQISWFRLWSAASTCVSSATLQTTLCEISGSTQNCISQARPLRIAWSTSRCRIPPSTSKCSRPCQRALRIWPLLLALPSTYP